MGKFESIGTIQPFLKLHEGEWANVYKAYDTSSRQNVLLKKLKSIFEHDTEVAGRFEAEANLMAKIQHPNVVSILTSGRSGSTVYFTAEFIEGLSLSDLLSHGALPPLIAVFVLRELAKGLVAAHEKQIFHRDIKPKNVLVSNSGVVKLTDFGMASILEANDDKELRGTIGYMAPELLFDGDPGRASDIFALGVAFYEMLTGTTAFRGESSREVFDNTLNYDPIPLLESNPKIAPSIIHICKTALEKDPQHRYRNCEDVITDLNALLGIAKGFNGKEEIVKYIANPEFYELSLAEQALFRALETERSNEFKSPSKKRSPSRIKLVLSSFLVVIFAFVVVYGVSERPIERPGLQEIKPITRSPDNAGSDLMLSDSSLISPSLNPETLSTHSDLSSNLLDSISNDVVNQEVRQVEQSSKDTMPTAEVLPPDLVNSSATGEVELLCNPFCTVYVNNDSMGVAPPRLSMDLPPGVHRLDLVHPVLPRYSRDIIVEAGRKDSIKIALRDYVGTVEIRVTPWAKVYIDDVFQGDVPPTKSFDFKPGEYILRLEHDLGIWTDTLLVIARERRIYKYNLSDLLK